MTPAIVHAQSGDDAATWYQRAAEQRQAGDYDAAWSALREAERLGFSPIRVNFEKARLHTLGGKPDQAISALEAIAETGFSAVGIIERDPVLAT